MVCWLCELRLMFHSYSIFQPCPILTNSTTVVLYKPVHNVIGFDWYVHSTGYQCQATRTLLTHCGPEPGLQQGSLKPLSQAVCRESSAETWYLGMLGAAFICSKCIVCSNASTHALCQPQLKLGFDIGMTAFQNLLVQCNRRACINYCWSATEFWHKTLWCKGILSVAKKAIREFSDQIVNKRIKDINSVVYFFWGLCSSNW